MSNTQQLSASVTGRFAVVLDRDVCATTAVDRLYAITSRIERQIDADTWEAFDAALVDVLDAVQVAFWRDGWQCGTNPALLVFEQETDPEPVPFEWRDVPGVDGVSIALSVDTVVSQILAGGAE